MSHGSPDLNLEVQNSANLIDKIKFVLIRVEIRLCDGFNCRPWSTFLRVWISMSAKLQIDSWGICSSAAASRIALPRVEHSATWKDFAVTSGERSQIRTIIEFSPVWTSDGDGDDRITVIKKPGFTVIKNLEGNHGDEPIT